MKRIKTIIESFLVIGRDPTAEIADAWKKANLYLAADDTSVRLLDNIMGAVLAASEEHKAKAAKVAKVAKVAKADSEPS